MLHYSLVSIDVIILLKCSYCSEHGFQSAALLLNWNENPKFLNYILLCAEKAEVFSAEIRFQYTNPLGVQQLALIWAIFAWYASKVSQLRLFVTVGEKNRKRSERPNSRLRRGNVLADLHFLEWVFPWRQGHVGGSWGCACHQTSSCSASGFTFAFSKVVSIPDNLSKNVVP